MGVSETLPVCAPQGEVGQGLFAQSPRAYKRFAVDCLALYGVCRYK
jgi:hypothetical protein